MITLGLSGNFYPANIQESPTGPLLYFLDSAACLIQDGTLLAAVEEERINRVKRTNKFPFGAIEACLDKANVRSADVDAVGYFFREDYTDAALNLLHIGNPAVDIRYSRETILEHLKTKFGIALPTDRLVYAPHHIAHARSVFERSGLDQALVVVMDGSGEEHSGTVFYAHGSTLETLAEYSSADSLGDFYLSATQFLGYNFGDEYKVMGLAPYGDPHVYRPIFNSLYELKSGGMYTINHNVVGENLLGQNTIASRFHTEGILPRRSGEEFTKQYHDFAAGAQEALENIVLHVLSYWSAQTGLSSLCFTGGVAQNSSLNGKILRSTIFERVFVHPAPHDGGACEGAALHAEDALLARRRNNPVQLRTSAVGPELGSTDTIQRKLAEWDIFISHEHDNKIVKTAANLLATGNVVGWATGPSEFGPRALGYRSILADPRPKDNQDRINEMIKMRESFRPFAPAVVPEAARTYFQLPKTSANYDFMSFVVHVQENRRHELGAVTHVDGTARLQVVDPDSNPKFYGLIKEFGSITGTPVLLNTSFNNNAEPIVQTIDDAIACFLTTNLDCLIVGDFVVTRRGDTLSNLKTLKLSLAPHAKLLTQTFASKVGAAPANYHYGHLDHFFAKQHRISPCAHNILLHANGEKTREILDKCGANEHILEELLTLWRNRLIVMEP